MRTRHWDMIDREATREANALRKARQHRSVNYKNSGNKGIVTRDQAIWDEHLEIHFTHCSFCNRPLDLDDEQSEPHHAVLKHGARVSLFTKDINICTSCMYLHKQLVRSCPVRSFID